MGKSAVLWLAIVVVCVAVGAGVPAWSQARVAARYAVTAEDLAAGRAALGSLAVRGRAPSTGYERERFGQAWADVDRNGCDTRNDVLRRDLTATVVENCVVLSGTLDDPYTGVPIPFARGPGSAQVQIDHVVALSDAWQKGAQTWTAAQREAFANDPANQEKGAGDAATWLPPQRGYRCVYALRQVRVKAAYGLWVTAAERDALNRELNRCVVATVRPP